MREIRRQEDEIVLIASENYVSESVLEATGSVLTNKYAEGYPGKRYYRGCQEVDSAEALAIGRAKKLFGAEYANVQPHAGSQANLEVYLAALEPGDTILAMNLAHGGHLTHGSKANLSGKIYNIVGYGVDPETEAIDYDTVARLAKEHKPRLLLAGASSYSRSIDFPKLAEIAGSVGALFMADIAHIAGLVVAGLHPDPVPVADFVTGTTHKTLRGPRGGFIVAKEKYAAAIDRAVFPGMQGGPLEHVIAGKAVCFQEAMEPSFATYAAQIISNCKTLCDEMAGRGYRIVSGGTDNHLFLVDLESVDLTGRKAARLLHEIGVTLNMNLIPFDKRKVNETSGIRIGTSCVTTRGMKNSEMKTLARIIDDRLKHPDDASLAKSLSGEVVELAGAFPVYPGLYDEEFAAAAS
ncbi:MAG: serine hydroxymethyltransferase [Planctomycetes bacterium]|nr:serine hydroxymethyltransferase [Planctomycetota bacterium]